MKSGVILDLKYHELVNALHNPLSAAPSDVTAGQIYYNSTDGYIYWSNGSSWVKVGSYADITSELSSALVNYVPKTRKINDVDLSADRTLELKLATQNPTGGGLIKHDIPSISSGKLTIEVKPKESDTATTANKVEYNARTITSDLTLTVTAEDLNVDAFINKKLTGNSADNILYNTALIGSPTAPNPSTGSAEPIATTGYVSSTITDALATADALTYKGTIAGGTTSPGTYTSAANKGDVYKVSTSGYVNGEKVEVGDMLICNTDGTAAASSSNYTTVKSKWDYIQSNIDTEDLVRTSLPTTTLTANQVIIGDGTHKVKASGYTIGKSVPSNAVFTDTNTSETGHYTPSGTGSAPTYDAGSGRTYVTDILLDSKKHVVGVKRATETVTNTHNVAKLYVNKGGSALGNVATTASEDTKISLYDGGTLQTTNVIKGSKSADVAYGGTVGATVTSDANGVITVASTDCRATKDGHYTPASEDGAKIDMSASSTTNATPGTTSLVTGVHITKDSKGHVTGATIDSIKLPAYPTPGNGTLTIQAKGTSKGTFTANQTGNTTVNITAGDLGITSQPVYKVVENVTGTSGVIDCGTGFVVMIVQARKDGSVFMLDFKVDGTKVTWTTNDTSYATADKVSVYIYGYKTV